MPGVSASHSTRFEIDREVNLQFAIDEQDVQEPTLWFGWRIYVTNISKKR